MDADFLLWVEFLLEDLHHALSTDREVLGLELLVILNSHKVVRSELRRSDLPSVAVEELDRHVASMFGEEGYGLLACLDALLQMPDGGPFPDEVLLPEVTQVVFGRVIGGFDDGREFLITKVVFNLVRKLLIVLIWVHFCVHVLFGSVLAVHAHIFHASGLTSKHVVLQATMDRALTFFWLFSGGSERGGRTKWWQLRGVDHSGRCPHVPPSHRGLLIRHDRQRKLSQLDVRIEVIELLVVGAVRSLGM